MPEQLRSLDFGLSPLRPVRVSLDESPALAGARYDMHFGLEFGVLLSGRMRRTSRLWEAEIEPGQAWFCGMWEPHGWEVSAGVCARLVFVILPTVLHQARLRDVPDLDWMAPFRVSPRERPQAHGRQRQQMLAIARRIVAQLDGRQAWPLPVIGVLELLLTLLDGWQGASRPYPAVDESQYRVVEQAIEYTLKARRIVTSQEAAAACAMSSRSFESVFDSLMGISFSRFVVRQWLTEAAEELAETTDSIADIAARCGFRHPSHFSHCFKRHYGVSPTAYRRARTR